VLLVEDLARHVVVAVSKFESGMNVTHEFPARIIRIRLEEEKKMLPHL